MKAITGRGFLILVSFSLVISIFASVGSIGDVQASEPTYVSHSPIHIASNDDLLALKASGGCTGSGTANDPYVISGFDISGNTTSAGGAGIYVSGITVHLVISNCYLHGNNNGVEIVRSSHVTVTDSNCSGNDPYGIFLNNTGYDTLTDNVCIDAAHGIYTFGSSNNIMKNNTCRATRACAIMMAGSSSNNVLSNNICYSSGDNGIYVLNGSNYNTLTNNTLRDNVGHGIHLANSDYNNVYGNVIVGNNGSSSVYNALHPQCADTGVGNRWNTGSSGNYWSDWTTPDANIDGIVDNPYPIGEGSSKDNHPLVNVPGTTVPGAPTNLTFSVDNGQVGLAWNAPADDGGAEIDYYVVYQNNADVAHVDSTSTIINNLTNGRSYGFAVAAHNSVGTGPKTAAVSVTPNPAPTVPGVPTGLTSVPGNAHVSLSWTTPDGAGGVAIDYYIVYQDGIDISHPATESQNVTGLTNGQSYSFTVAAHNSVGVGGQTTADTATPTSGVEVPGVPTDLTITEGDGTVTLSWTAPSNSSNIDYYIVYQNEVDVRHTSFTTVTITGLTNGENYTFAVAAHNSGGVGTQSSTQTVSNGAASPNGANATNGSNLLYFSVVLAILAVAMVAGFLVLRRSKRKL